VSDEIVVLVVDDERGMRETLVDILSQCGYRVWSAADGDAAFEAIQANRFDVVVMDIKMPGRDGVSVLRESDAPPPQVILMTAYANSEQVRGALDANAFAVVNKPFQVKDLLGLIASAVSAAA
jgi:two-component system, NtrC family, response regulator AtoC